METVHPSMKTMRQTMKKEGIHPHTAPIHLAVLVLHARMQTHTVQTMVHIQAIGITKQKRVSYKDSRVVP